VVFVTGEKHIASLCAALAKGGAQASSEGAAAALMRAALIGHTAAVRALLEGGAAVDGLDAQGWTPLMQAVFAGHLDTIRALIQRGADVNRKDRAGWTPLMEAASKGHREAVIILLASGADVKAKSGKGWTALKAAPKGDAELVRLLKQAGAI
jgi:ankyrin repeat protein